MAQVIKIKSSIVPGNVPSSLETGELGINVTDGSFFFGSATTVSSTFKFSGLTVTGDITTSGNINVNGTVDGIDIATDVAANTSKNSYPTSASTKVGHISVTQAVDLDVMENDIIDNNTKQTNATHTGDVTGSGALTIGANKVDDTHIDWGTGTNQVSYDDIPNGGTYVRTTNDFTSDEKTKLESVETGSDRTTTAKVDTAGATMNTDTSLSGNGYFLDENTMSSNSNTKVASQQSIKAYVDTQTIPYVISTYSWYMGSFTNNNWYYGNNSHGNFHHQFNAKWSTDPDGLNMQTTGSQHNGVIVPFDTKNIGLKANVQGATANNTVTFEIFKCARQGGGVTPTLTRIGSDTVTILDESPSQTWKFLSIDITTTESVSAGDQIYVMLKPGGTSGVIKTTYTLYGEYNA